MEISIKYDKIEKEDSDEVKWKGGKLVIK